VEYHIIEAMPEHHRRNSLKDSFRRAFGKQPHISDPILPPGGLPLPAVIKRKFSFAPQLPEISRISLLPGFTASQYSLNGLNFQERPPAISRRLLIQAPETMFQAVRSDRQDKQEKEQLGPNYPMSMAMINDLVRYDSSSSRHTIRKVHGQENLKTSVSQTGSSSDSHMESSTDIILTPNTTQQSLVSEKALSGRQPRFTEAALHPGTEAVEHDSISSDCPIIEYAKDIPNLLRSFYINDHQLPGNPINVMSHDLTPPEDLQDGEGLFLDLAELHDDCSDLLTSQAADGEIEYHLVFAGDLVCQGTGQTRYLLTAQVNVTRLLVHNVLEHISSALGSKLAKHSRIGSEVPRGKDDDAWTPLDWFSIAQEEMENATSNTSDTRNKYPEKEKPKEALEASSIAGLIHTIKSFYRDYFVLRPSTTERGYYEISYVSRSIFESGEHVDGHLMHTAPEIIEEIGRALARGKELAVQIKWGLKGVDKWMYCVPMFGPKLNCWICSLVDGSLPYLWEK